MEFEQMTKRRVPRGVGTSVTSAGEATGTVPRTTSAPVTSASIFDASVVEVIDVTKENQLAQSFVFPVDGNSNTNVSSASTSQPAGMPTVAQLLQEMAHMRVTMQAMQNERRESRDRGSATLSGAPIVSSRVYNENRTGLNPNVPATSRAAPSFPFPSLPVANPTSSGSSRIPVDKVAQIMSKWAVRFKGNENDPLTVKDFLYRVSALTTSTLHGDFQLLCNNISVLLEDRASTWFWRFHAREGGVVTWVSFCQEISEEFRDRRSDFRIRELIRNRKQKEKEKFDVYYNGVLQLVDRLSGPLPNAELIEILRNNLRPELQRGILYVPTSTVGHLREIILQHEILEEELSKSSGRGNTMSRIVSEVDSSGVDSVSEDTELVEALASGSGNLRCWNCSELGHRWDSCQSSDWRRFCWGCGAPNVIKPKCPHCTSVSKNVTRPRASKSPPRL